MSVRMTKSNSDSDSDLPNMMSDGKRMRAIWRPGDGNGDGTRHVFERTKATLRGHPTWKIFTEDVATPFTRGSKEEPPHYVYLDDAACYIVYKSGQYTDQELRKFWPFDFDHQGNIKTGRFNRGRPAWVDGDVPEIAQGKLRGNKQYNFTGAPEVTGYKPLRTATLTMAEREVHAEWAARKNGNTHTTNTPLSTPSESISTTESFLEDTSVINDELQPKLSREARLERVSALRPSPPRYPPPPVPKQHQKRRQPDPLHISRGTSSDPEPWVNSAPNSVLIPKRKRGPFIDSSSSTNGSPPASKCARLNGCTDSLPEVPSEILRNDQGGELRSSSLLFELPKDNPDIGSDDSSEDDEFLASRYHKEPRKFKY